MIRSLLQTIIDENVHLGRNVKLFFRGFMNRGPFCRGRPALLKGDFCGSSRLLKSNLEHSRRKLAENSSMPNFSSNCIRTTSPIVRTVC